MSTHTRNRGLVWLTATAAALSLAMAIAGFKDWLPPEFTWFGLALFLCCLVVIGMVGWRTRKEMLALRDEAARGQMIVMLAARLRDEDARQARADGRARRTRRRGRRPHSPGESRTTATGSRTGDLTPAPRGARTLSQ